MTGTPLGRAGPPAARMSLRRVSAAAVLSILIGHPAAAGETPRQVPGPAMPPPFATGPVPVFLREYARAASLPVAPAVAAPNRLDPGAFTFAPPERDRSPPRAPPFSAAAPQASAGPADGEPERTNEDHDDNASSLRPGGFTREPLLIPSRFLKTRTVAPHTKPDVSYDVSERTSIGMFGELNQVGRTDARAALKPEREVGAGFTLQYRFGRP